MINKNKNAEYWRKRFEINQENLLKPTDDYIDELKEIYTQTEKELEKEIRVWYQRFADNNGITDMAEARRQLNNKELAELKWDVKEYIKRGKENGIYADWSKELENASARVHISRLEALKLQCRGHIEELYRSIDNNTELLIGNTYKESLYHTAYEIAKGININTNFAFIDTERLTKVISKPWSADGVNFSKRIWGEYRPKLVNTVHNTLSRGIMTGKSPDKIIIEVEKTMKTSRNNAARLVMTESAYFASQGQKDSYNTLGVKRYRILGTLDSGTCDDCGSLDGKDYDMKDFEAGVTAPPFHCFCRCTTVPYFDDEFTEGEKRFARDKDGKAVYVDADMTYTEWKKKFVDNTVKNGVDNSSESGIIKIRPTKVIEGHSPPPKKSNPNDVIDHIGKSGRVDVRSFYGNDGFKQKDIHTTNHNNPKNHSYGENGEHVHIYSWSDDGKLKEKTVRNLTDIERKENSDIL